MKQAFYSSSGHSACRAEDLPREFSQTSGEWCTSATSQAPREPLFVGCTMIALGFYNIHPSSGSVSGNPSNPFCFPLKFHFTLLLLLFFSQIDKTMFYFIPALPHCPASSRKPSSQPVFPLWVSSLLCPAVPSNLALSELTFISPSFPPSLSSRC